uniref:Replication-associated protein n=1 Tax=maize striate mosaic virus TaxID=2025388 RepID=A0A286QUZ9_9GEMI|nr:replication-associated protein [Maize striate mosaic virus]
MSHTSFRFRAKNVFLTYPRCPIGPEFLCDHLWNLVTPYDPLYVHVAQENHKDGGLHSHVLIQTRIEISTFDPTYFDYTGTSIPGAVVFHPNIQACRNVRDCLAYIRKNTINEVSKGAFKCSGAGRPKKQDTAPSRDAKMCQIMSSATSRSDYLSMVRGAFPFEWATKLAQFEYSASKLFPDAPTTNAIPSNIDLTCHENIMPWLRDDLYTERGQGRRPRSLYICGRTRTGKTTWARSLGPHNYFQHQVDYFAWSEEATYVVIDDIPFKFCPNWKAIVGSQHDYTVNPKYGKKRKIKGGIPAIILVNEDEDWLMSMTTSQIDWFLENCVVYHMTPGESFFNYAE